MVLLDRENWKKNSHKESPHFRFPMRSKTVFIHRKQTKVGSNSKQFIP